MHVRLWHIVFLSLVSANGLYASWIEGGIPVCDSDSSQNGPVIAAAGNGVVIAWQDARAYRRAIYAQKLGMDGARAWTDPGGVKLANQPHDQHDVAVVGWPNGNSAFVWVTDKDTTVGYHENLGAYGQKLNDGGSAMWPDTGIFIRKGPAPNPPYAPDLITYLGLANDTNGGIAAAWQAGTVIQAEGLNYGGVIAWGFGKSNSAQDVTTLSSGKPKWPWPTQTKTEPMILSDGNNGVFIGYRYYHYDYTAGYGFTDLGVMRLNIFGVVHWACFFNDYGGTLFQLSSNGRKGVIAYWWSGGPNVAMFDSMGIQRWRSKLATLPSEIGVREKSIAGDGQGGAYIAWQDNRNGNYDVYAQHVDASGRPLWAAGGKPVCTLPDSQVYPKLVSFDQYGVMVSWLDKRNSNYDIYAQLLDYQGTACWQDDGIPVCTAAGNQSMVSAVREGNAGVFVWQDQRNGINKVYAQRVNYDGSYTQDADTIPPAPVTDLHVVQRACSTLTLQWTAPGDGPFNGPASSYDIRFSTVPITPATWNTCNRPVTLPYPSAPGTTQQCAVIGLIPGKSYYFAVQSIDHHLNISAISNNACDSTAKFPSRVNDFNICYAGQDSMTFEWTAPNYDTAAGIPDHYQIRFNWNPWDENYWDYQYFVIDYYTGAYLPVPGERQTCTTARPGYNNLLLYYALKIWDNHGHGSGMSNEISYTYVPPPDTVITPPDTVITPPDTVITPPDTVISPNREPDSLSLWQVYPNPATLPVSFSYKIPSGGIVDLSVFSITGQLIFTLSHGYQQSGRHTVTWDGINRHGVKVKSGLYFYQLKGAGFRKIKRFIVLR